MSNHIQENFDKMLNRYVNIMFKKKELEEKYSDKEQKMKIRSTLKRIKKDLLFNENKSDKKFNMFIKNFRKILLKDVKINKSLMYMAKAKPLNLLIVLIRMSVQSEKFITENKTLEKDILFNVINCFPLRKTIRPKYIDIDVTIIILNLISTNKKYYNQNKLMLSDEIWNMFFKTDKMVFKKKGYTFNRRISTDGIGCSILLVRNDLFNPFKKTYVRTIKKPKNYSEENYVNELTQVEKNYCLGKQLIGVDPGKDKLVYCSNGVVNKIHKKNGKIFRQACHYSYSQKLRKETIKSGIYMNKIEKDKKKTTVIFKKKGSKRGKKKTIKQVEELLSKINSSSCIWSNVLDYVKIKNEVNNSLLKYYEKPMYRELNWHESKFQF